VARLLRPQGRRGELLAEPLTDVPGVLTAGVLLWLASSGAERPAGGDAVTVEEVWTPTGRNAGRIVLKLAGTDNISGAEKLGGQQLMVPVSALPALESDQFYVRDLLGCLLVDGDKPIGEIVDVQFATTPDGTRRLEDAAALLEVQPAVGGETVLVPFVRAWLLGVDAAARRVEMKLPEGLVGMEGVETAAEAGEQP
jgi:16S rRNA processing protein RimM